jgi:succinyl-CoA synthetase beta subunit
LDLYEYQGKELLRKYGLETLPGIVAETPEEARGGNRRHQSAGLDRRAW